jgi:segregation and condensation protein B
MAKEINLFEQEVEDHSLEAEEPLKLAPALSDILEKIQLSQEQQFREKQARNHIKGVVEALLFASSEPITFIKIREVTDTILPLKPRVLREIIQELMDEYLSQRRAFRLEEIAQGFLLRTCEEYSSYIEILYKNKRTEKLSHPAAEVLAIIAYKQPITRPQIDAIRGVDSSGTIQSLLERQLIEPVGKLEAPGRPTLFGITKDFLKHFGLRDLSELTSVKPIAPAETK